MLISVLLIHLAWSVWTVQGSHSSEGPKMVDLSHPYNNETIFWFDNAKFVLNITTRGATPETWYQMDAIQTQTHGGTHLDAPIHFSPGRWTVSEIPLKRLVDIPVSVVDIKTKATKRRDYRVSVRDIQAWESKHGNFPNSSLLIIRTGRGRLWPDREAYMGIDENNVRHYPSIHPKTARWLMSNRKIHGVGLDTPSVDPPDRSKTHRILSAKNIYILENLANLEKLPPVGAKAIVMPMKIDGASGAPCRVVAVLPRKEKRTKKIGSTDEEMENV